MNSRKTYHHGDLRAVCLDAAVEALAEGGPAALSLRELARRAGVSHAAPAHHFGDKTGLLTAVAAQGYELLANELDTAWKQADTLIEAGVAYVRFAVQHPAHFEVMFRPTLYRSNDPQLAAARTRAGELLERALSTEPGAVGDKAGVAAWSIVHGFAALWLGGTLSPELGEDPEDAARSVIHLLFEG
ncbi:TetR/AcrR family transcriptional regulator [Nocardia sp. CWNU-33]|uniref:TetR/AcrR family transcriptional regulator n=1 Tax=Nocardia sp. CWNU-33 TaxID=3392117 RepID=UPI00398EDA88